MRKRDRDETLRGLAHNLWVQRGKPIGSPEVDWIRAEALLAEIGESIKLVNAALEKVQLSSDGPYGPHEESAIGKSKPATLAKPGRAQPAQAQSRTTKKTAASKRAAGNKPPKRTLAKDTLVARGKPKPSRKTERKPSPIDSAPHA